MLDFGFYNIDCMQGMKEFPDNYFDLAIVDPPYGAGFTEGGGCQGWFSKYHQNPENTDNIGSGGDTTDSAIREAYSRNTKDIPRRLARKRQVLSRTGGTWASKYAKKS